MNILIDKITNGVVSVSGTPNPLTYSIELPDSTQLYKTIEVVEGEKQKTNENNQPLYRKVIQNRRIETAVVCKEETTELTDEPILIQVHKTDTDGSPLYYYFDGENQVEVTDSVIELKVDNQPILLEDGTQKRLVTRDKEGNNTSLPLYYTPVGFEQFDTTEPFRTVAINLQPIIITIQKTYPEGNPLYLKDIIEEREIVEESYIEVEYEKEPIKWETQMVPNMALIPDEIEPGNFIEIQDGEREIQVPVEWDTYEAVLVPNIIPKQVTLQDNPSEFTINDILQAKYKNILENSSLDYIIADVFLNEDDLDLTDVNHSANTGKLIVQLNPYGQVKTKSIELEEPTSHFEILELDVPYGVDVYLNGEKFTDGKLTLASPVSKCILRFVNTVDNPRLIKSYCIGY